MSVSWRKLTLSLTIYLTATVLNAGTMGAVCEKEKADVPCPEKQWGIGIHGLYLFPTFNNALSWVGVNASSTTTTNGARTLQTDIVNQIETSAESTWGFEIHGAYNFNNGKNVNLSWYHLSQNTTTLSTNDLRTSNGAPWFKQLADVDSSLIKFTPYWDAINLELGQKLDIGKTYKLRLYGGFEYAILKFNSTEDSADFREEIVIIAGAPTVVTHTVTTQATNASAYYGIGPRIGSDLGYDIGSGVDIFAKLAASLLLGDSISDTHITQASNNATLRVHDYISLVRGRRITIVPELEGKVGIAYNTKLAKGDLSLDAGYMWINYFNALTVYGSQANSDFGLNGIFFGGKWVGNLLT